MADRFISYTDYETLGFNTKRELYFALNNDPLRIPLAQPLAHGATHALIAFGQRDNDWMQLYICSVAPTNDPEAENLWIHLFLNFYSPAHNIFGGDTVRYVISADDLDTVLAYEAMGPYECNNDMPWGL